MRINLRAVTKFARLPYFSHSVPSRQLSQQYVSETYNRHLEQSLKNPEEYWGEISENTIWTKVDGSETPQTLGHFLLHVLNE